MLICFAPMFTTGMKINDVNHILGKSQNGTLKTNPYNLPLNKQRTKMPSSACLGQDSQLSLAGSSRRQSLPRRPQGSAAQPYPVCHDAVPRPCQAFASPLAPRASWRAGSAPSFCQGGCRLGIPHPRLFPPQQLPAVLLKTLLLFPVFKI